MKKAAVVALAADTPLAQPSFTLIDKQNRGPLSEGRTYQLGFAFCKRSGTELHTVHPLSPCKDYLNDVVYAETTGKSISAYGLSAKKQGIFEDGVGYLVIKILPFKNGDYPEMQKDIENLRATYPNIERLLNHYETLLGLETKTTVEPLSENTYLLQVPLFWCSQLWLISLYSLLVRVAQWYKGGESPEDFLRNKNNFTQDSYLVQNAEGKLQRLLQGERPQEDLSGLHGVCLHNAGVCNVRFKVAVKTT